VTCRHPVWIGFGAGGSQPVCCRRGRCGSGPRRVPCFESGGKELGGDRWQVADGALETSAGMGCGGSSPVSFAKIPNYLGRG